MSHYTVLVQANNESELEQALAPFDENMEVAPYITECWCVGNAAKRAAYKAVDDSGLSIDPYRAAFFEKYGKAALNEDMQQVWIDEFYSQYEALRTPIYQQALDAHPMKDKPNPECSNCGGAGIYEATHNPAAKWDWYSIGGRWNGCIPGNHATGRQILDIGYLPFAILTITGWHEKGQMGWWAMVANEKGKPDWDAECHEILSANEDKLFYLVDCHI